MTDQTDWVRAIDAMTSTDLFPLATYSDWLEDNDRPVEARAWRWCHDKGRYPDLIVGYVAYAGYNWYPPPASRVVRLEVITEEAAALMAMVPSVLFLDGENSRLHESYDYNTLFLGHPTVYVAYAHLVEHLVRTRLV